MKSGSPARASRHGKAVRIFSGLVILSCLYFVGIFAAVALQSSRDESRPVDVIVVFGAAEYAGKPSPVYRARLDRAYDLFQQGLAPVVITSGGHGNDPHFSEGGVGRDYLMKRGIPEEKLIAETTSDSTIDSVRRVAVIMRTNKMNTALAVSDDYHLFRIKQMLAREGVTAYGSPRKSAIALTWKERVRLTTREIMSYTLWLLHVT